MVSMNQMSLSHMSGDDLHREMTNISLRLLSNPFHPTALLYYLCFAYCIKENE